ncbi:NAD(P)-dependent dehydrogenase (short-subunit alcohol dehydrogenase family) [Crossiella equi]|uniref:NAD(P)-dependent dehydrogenase (Short-subunit alcohol dehydrogenase family) n=1 Tax=Crossiella equi TaxID=130796 RepID=A0ABS5ARE8_9PSEU|nr:oxidoreductase [Crossiella equi]MBP2479131.1 NAD(P)-dependent dehydrogenase (short-subunit alcohol dehydrogenase family) [Crossiella equi]
MSEQNWTEADVPDQQGRVAIVTGSNTGIGYDTAAVLARRGATVVLAVRDPEKGKQAAERITASAPGAAVRLQRLDLSSLDSVRTAAAELRDSLDRIDLLINNAGVMYTPRSKTQDGFELQFGTNHLGHFAFTGLLLDRVLATPGSRVVTVASMAHNIRAKIHFEDLQWERRYDRVAAYGQAKLANVKFGQTAHSGGERYPQVRAHGYRPRRWLSGLDPDPHAQPARPGSPRLGVGTLACSRVA